MENDELEAVVDYYFVVTLLLELGTMAALLCTGYRLWQGRGRF